MRGIFYIVLFLSIGCTGKKKYHDKKEIKTSSSIQIQEVIKYQENLNASFKNPETSPLPDRYRKSFESLDFYIPDTTYIVKATLVRTPEAIPFMMPTNTAIKRKEVVYGVLHFMIKGVSCQLEVYKGIGEKEAKDYLFLPFMDATNGKETYEGGRYIDLSIPTGNIIELDFNKAYNPYCAYNKKYSCPKVPLVNMLALQIKAGVKAFVP